MRELGSTDIIDIEACYKKCFVVQKMGKLKCWGKFLASKKYDDTKDKKKTESKVYVPSVFPRNVRFNTNFQKIVLGPNHACAIPVNQVNIYVWGHNNL